MRFWPYLVAFSILLGTLGFLENMSAGEPKLPKTSFSSFPLSLADRWLGREVGMDPEIVDVLKVSDYMMRYYQPMTESAATEKEPPLSYVSLYIGYYESQRTGATYHSPKNCLPGSGWTFAESDTVSIPITHNGPGPQTILANKVLIQKGIEKQLVIYWYHDRGRTIASEYMAKAYMIWDAMAHNRTDGALVRIIVPINGSTEHAFQTGVTFIHDMWSELLHHMPPPIST